MYIQNIYVCIKDNIVLQTQLIDSYNLFCNKVDTIVRKNIL